MIPEVVLFAIGDGGLGWVVVNEGQMAVGVGRADAVEFGNSHGLNDGEALVGTVLQIEAGFLAVEFVEEFPGGVGQIEKRTAVFIHQIVAVVGHAELLGDVGCSGTEAQQQ